MLHLSLSVTTDAQLKKDMKDRTSICVHPFSANRIYSFSALVRRSKMYSLRPILVIILAMGMRIEK
jgi:hypothetical protein